MEKENGSKNFWEEPVFWFLIGIILLSQSGQILRSLGIQISQPEVDEIVGQTVIWVVVGFILFLAIKNYKTVLVVLGALLLLGLFIGLIKWFFALPATTIIIILLLLLLSKGSKKPPTIY